MLRGCLHSRTACKKELDPFPIRARRRLSGRNHRGIPGLLRSEVLAGLKKRYLGRRSQLGGLHVLGVLDSISRESVTKLNVFFPAEADRRSIQIGRPCAANG